MILNLTFDVDEAAAELVRAYLERERGRPATNEDIGVYLAGFLCGGLRNHFDGLRRIAPAEKDKPS